MQTKLEKATWFASPRGSKTRLCLSCYAITSILSSDAMSSTKSEADADLEGVAETMALEGELDRMVAGLEACLQDAEAGIKQTLHALGGAYLNAMQDNVKSLISFGKAHPTLITQVMQALQKYDRFRQLVDEEQIISSMQDRLAAAAERQKEERSDSEQESGAEQTPAGEEADAVPDQTSEQAPVKASSKATGSSTGEVSTKDADKAVSGPSTPTIKRKKSPVVDHTSWMENLAAMSADATVDNVLLADSDAKHLLQVQAMVNTQTSPAASSKCASPVSNSKEAASHSGKKAKRMAVVED
eukprot:s1134_g3.t1